MVKTINKINKDKYKKNNNKTVILAAGIAIALVIGVAAFLMIGTGSNTANALVGPAPSGDNCPENIAYLQSGVDKYKEMTGQVPAALTELTQKIGDKSIVEKLPECPSGNTYLIENGKVVEGPPKQ